MRKSWALALALAACTGAAVAIARQGRGGATLNQSAILAIEDDRAATDADVQALLAATRGQFADAAIRALGRLERRELITDLLPFLANTATRSEAATALVLALRGPDLAGVPYGQQERAVLAALISAGEQELARPAPASLGPIARAVGRVPRDPEAFKDAETFLRKILEKPFPAQSDAPHAFAARGLEALARLNRKFGAFANDTIVELEADARTADPARSDIQRNALAALIAAQRVDDDTLRVVMTSRDAEVRRSGAIALTGSGSPIEDDLRIGHIRHLLADSSPMVRLEAVRAWIRRGVAQHGCQPLVDAMRDRNPHVALFAIDALGDACKDDESITVLIASEARTPPPRGWQRPAHAFVALAKRDRERAFLGLLTFATHQTWQVRMYAARAAALLDDAEVLGRLAADADDNVAEAALPPLRRLKGADSDAAFIAALNRRTRTPLANPDAAARPYQVIRAAALALDKAEPTRALAEALAGALDRITAEKCETSRDARLALIERLGQLGSPAQSAVLVPLLTDIDPKVGAAAAELFGRWTGKAVRAEPPQVRSADIPSEDDLRDRVQVTLEMEGGGTIEILPLASTPLTRQRFLAAVRRGYYNGLTFHRVVPNFVIQGGSPGANEYCGDCPFMRDEPGAMHTRGTLGISTRGRDTGDAQIFVNLVDNPRLDFDYTVFAVICSGIEVADAVQEGDRIIRAQALPVSRSCGG
jgi:cyclophilin family peptidyl-prolyl cis-trans isomerase